MERLSSCCESSSRHRRREGKEDILRRSQNHEVCTTSFLVIFVVLIFLERKLKHKNIVLYHGVSLDHSMSIIMEYVPKSLSKFISKSPPIRGNTFIKISSGIADGMAYLHLNNIIHRDLKPGNVCPQFFLPCFFLDLTSTKRFFWTTKTSPKYVTLESASTLLTLQHKQQLELLLS